MRNILFRADSSSTVGTGHIMRDLVLASQYKNANIIFATQDLDGNINNKILDAGYKVELLKSNDIKEVNKLIQKYSIDMLVIDSYNIGVKKEKKIKNKTGVEILSFDDTYERHHCDILLNHNISADEKKYKGLLPLHCELRCGSKYTLLRDEFLKEKKKIYKQNIKKKTIFLAMGGADHSQKNIKILKVLEKFDNIKVNLLTTSANENLTELDEFCDTRKFVKLHINSNKVAKLMKKSDFAIVTPSVTLNEIYFMDVPFIAIKTAKNQEDMYQYLKNNKFLALDEFKPRKLKIFIQKMLKS